MIGSHPHRLPAACLVAVAVAACGGGSASKKDVIARGNAICAVTLRSVRTVAPLSAGANTATVLRGYLQRVLPIVEKEVTQLRKLPRPAADKAILVQYIAAVSQAGVEYRALAAAAQRNDVVAVARGLAALRSNPAGSLARQYGLTQCATAAGTSNP